MIISRNVDYFELLLDKTRNHNGVINADDLDIGKIKNAFERSHDIRKFEIGLYWQRSGYILGFLSVLAAAIAYCFSVYFKETTSENTKFIMILTMTCLSVIGISLCNFWRRIIKASKYWQENWEYNIDILEPFVSGNLHKIHFYRTDKQYNRFSIHEVVLSICNRINIILYIIVLFVFALIINELFPYYQDIPISKETIYLVGSPLLLIILLIEFVELAYFRKSDKTRQKSRVISKNKLKVTIDKINCSKS